jgi:hypothetical protein
MGSVTVAETIVQRVGIDRCEGPLQTLFALTLIDLAAFEWRRPDGHGPLAWLAAHIAGATGSRTAASPICYLSPAWKR